MKQAGTTILLVDDDPHIREGLHALKHLDRLPLAIVVDMAMPVLDGRGFLEQRARDQILAGIPVIVVSGNQPPKALANVETSPGKRPII